MHEIPILRPFIRVRAKEYKNRKDQSSVYLDINIHYRIELCVKDTNI